MVIETLSAAEAVGSKACTLFILTSFQKPKVLPPVESLKECRYEAILHCDNKAKSSSGRQRPHTETDWGQQTEAVVVCLQAFLSAQWLTVK